MTRLSLRWTETMAASAFVMNHRAGVMMRAAENPVQADVGELGRMIPEKADAFYRGFKDMGHARDPLDAAERLLSPIHKRATANAKRLKSKGKKVRAA
jgi:hypothetical protein